MRGGLGFLGNKTARGKRSCLASKTKPRRRKKIVRSKAKKKKNGQLSLVILFSVGLLLLSLAFVEGQNLWKFMHVVLFGLFGILAYFIGILAMLVSVLFSFESLKKSAISRIWCFVLLFILICAQIQMCFGNSCFESEILGYFEKTWFDGVNSVGGGIFGGIFGFLLEYALGRQAAIIFDWILIFALSFILTGLTLIDFLKIIYVPVKKIENGVKNVGCRKKFNIDIPIESAKAPSKFVVPNLATDQKKMNKVKKNRKDGLNKVAENANDSEPTGKDQLDDLVNKASSCVKENDSKKFDKLGEFSNSNGYVFPSINLLTKPKLNDSVDISAELRANADLLVDTLKSFGVETRIVDICRGPSVTRYELQPSAGVKISKITNLADDISLNLAAGGVRIEAPIPNKAAVGIEVPNKTKNMVLLREIISSEEFSNSKSFLSFALGKDIAGNVKIADIAKMPHVLIAGATGAGKSVCVNSIIVSLLYKSSPEEVRLLMIDPKVVELGVYNGIPHLLVPVVTDPKKAAGALGWAVTEMLKRYQTFAKTGVRDLRSYNKLVESGKLKDEIEPYSKMPQIVIIIDELADLMMAASREVEDSVCRLAQMARAAGMHLVIATQRPSVDVITGLIKANIPSRIAFTVSSQVDSRTIMDSSGAEKLLGKGDMLYCPIDQQKPVRVQGCFVSDEEVERVVNFIKSKKKVEYSSDILEEIDRQVLAHENGGKSAGGGEFLEQDPVILDAMETIIDSQQASTSFLQRRLKLGYARAARVMDELEARGVVGPQCGSKSREILMSKQQFLEMQLAKNDNQ